MMNSSEPRSVPDDRPQTFVAITDEGRFRFPLFGFRVRHSAEGFRVDIAVPDVTEVGLLFDPIHEQAARRAGVQIYSKAQGRTVRLYPREAFSQAEFSASENAVRQCLITTAWIDGHFNVTGTEVKVGLVTDLEFVDVRGLQWHMPASQEIDGSPEKSVALALLVARARARQRMVQSSGGWIFDMSRFNDEDQIRVNAGYSNSTVAALILARELRILGNIAVTDCASEESLPLLYRASVWEAPRQFASHYCVDPQRNAIIGEDAYASALAPLERYTDLINFRQVVAFCKGDPLPFTLADLEDLAPPLTDVMDRRGLESRSDDPEAMVAQIEEALEAGDASWLSGLEIQTTLKKVGNGKEIPAALLDSLVQRIADKSIDHGSLVQVIRLGIYRPLPDALTAALVSFISDSSRRAAMAATSLVQDKVLSRIKVESDFRAPFRTRVVTGIPGTDHSVHGRGKSLDRRQDAVFMAKANLVRRLIGMPNPDEPQEDPLGEIPPANNERKKAPAGTRAELLSLIAQRGWAAPVIETTETPSIHGGPPLFRVTVTLSLTHRTLTSAGEAHNKKGALDQAAYSLLRTLRQYGLYKPSKLFQRIFH